MPCVCRPQRPGRRVGCLALGLCLPAGDSFGNLRWEWLGAVGSPRLGWGGVGVPEALAGGSGLCGVVLTASCLTDPVEFLVPPGTLCVSVPV